MSRLSNSSLRVVTVLVVGAALHLCPGSGWLPVAAAQSSLPGAVWFALGPGGSDVISHQVVRTKDDRLYIFTSRQSETTLRVYRTTAPGLPGSAAAFAVPITQTAPALPLSLDAVYDGNTIVHVLINTQAGQVIDYPFDLASNTFRSPTTLATDGGTVNAGMYIGSIGLSAMMDKTGQFHVAYWSGTDHIRHGVFTYNGATNAVTQVGGWTQVDAAGAATHPAVAVSPRDNSLTVAWISQADTPPRIRARTRSSGGTWGSVESVSSAPVWVCTRGDQDCNGINIDQGPSLVIDASGTRHLAYIEDIGAVADYGRIHYATNSGSGWSDRSLSAFSHTPALALDAADTPYIVGHGHPLSPTCTSMDDMCVVKKNANGTWEAPQLFAQHPPGSSFDNATSVKWSVVGFNRPDAIEFAFYQTPYHETTLLYGRFGSQGSPTRTPPAAPGNVRVVH